MSSIPRWVLRTAVVVAGCAPAAPAAAAPRHGTRVASGPVQSETAAQIMSSSAGRHGPPHGLRARRGEPDKHTGSGPTTSVSAPSGDATGPRTSFGSSFNFDGPTLDDTSGVFPPDTQGAVGPSQFLVTINGRFRSYSKTTGLPDGALDVDPDVFFASQLSTPPAGGFVFSSDPHVRYDRLSQRWFIVMIDAPLDASGNASKANRILVAHSDGPTLSPSTVWTKTFVQVSGAFADYPTLGVDATALYVGTNNFATSGQFGFTGTSGYVISKASVLANGALTVTKFALVGSGTGAGPFTPQGADNPDPSATQGYFAGVDNQFFSRLDIVRISTPGGTPTASGNLTVTVPTTAFPLSVPHQGNTGGALDALDDRLFAASIRGNHLWTAHNIQVNTSGTGSSTGGRDGSRWYELNLTTTPSLVQSGTVFDSAASNPLSYWIPTVAVSGQGHMAIGGSVAGATHHVDAWFSGRLSSDAAGTLDSPTLYTASTAAYNPLGDPGDPRRWGDFSAVSLDPSDDMTLWTIQEYVPSANTWGTRIARLRAPGPATPASVTPRVVAGHASVPVTLTGSTTGGRGFYDPGAGFTRPQVTAGCGVTVTSVTVTSPSQASLVLDTTGASGPGPCLITFTNPDGQSAAASVLTFDHAPVAVDDAASVDQDTVLSGSSVLANDTDADADPLTASKATDPSHGTVTVSSDGTYTYTPSPGYTGPDAFTYTVSDGVLQDTGTVSITVDAADHAPVAVDDSYSVAQDTVLNGSSVLANDTDADGDPLTAAKATDPAHGAVTVNADGTFTYTPTAGYSGPDAFTYTVSDGTKQDTGTVSITVTHVNRAPVAHDDSYSVAQDTVLHGSSVLANDTDADSDPLTAAKATDPAHGAVTVAADGTFTYTPAGGYVGPDVFTYTVSDGALQDTGTVSITVTHVDHAPVARDDAYAVAEGSVLNGASVLANDSDPDGDPLTASKATDPAHGTVTVNGDGTFTYTPAAGYFGPDAFTYTAADGALHAAATVRIAVTPTLPDLSNPGTQPPTQQPAPVTKLTLSLKKLKRRKGRLRLRASGAGPAAARVRVVLRRGTKRVAAHSTRVTRGQWHVVFSFKRHGRYSVTATSGTQRVMRRKRA